MDNKLVVSRKKKQIIVEELRKRQYEAFPKNADKKSKAAEDDAEDDEGEEADIETDTGVRDYDYLLSVCHSPPSNSSIPY
jgi:DNA topoisomerase II